MDFLLCFETFDEYHKVYVQQLEAMANKKSSTTSKPMVEIAKHIVQFELYIEFLDNDMEAKIKGVDGLEVLGDHDDFIAKLEEAGVVAGYDQFSKAVFDRLKEGEEVTAGQTLMVLEAMKMEMGVEAPFDGIVRSVKVINNLQLQTGTPLIQLEPKGDGKASQAPLLSFAAFSTPESVATESYSPYLRQVTGMMLGFDANEDLAFPQWAQDLPEQAQ